MYVHVLMQQALQKNTYYNLCQQVQKICSTMIATFNSPLETLTRELLTVYIYTFLPISLNIVYKQVKYVNQPLFLVCIFFSQFFCDNVQLMRLIDKFTFEYWPVSQPQTDESLVILLQHLHQTELCQVQHFYYSTIQGQFIKDFYIKLQKIK